MARPKKESKPFNIKMSAELYDRLEKYCVEMGQTKTTAVERMVSDALDRYEKTTRRFIMGYNDHLHDINETIVVCKHCGKSYKQWREDQLPGFRDKDDDICPYCGESNGSSMEEEFHNSKID